MNKKKFKLITRYRVVPRSFGIYKFMNQDIISCEIEEVCVEQKSLPLSDYIYCREFALTITLFYNDKIFYELISYLDLKDVSVTEWLTYIHDNKERFFAESLLGLYNDFIVESNEELHNSKEKLEALLRDNNGKEINRYINGEVGNNILFNTQAKVYIDFMNEIHVAAYTSVIDLLGKDVDILYLNELMKFSLMKKAKFMDIDSATSHIFHYNFVRMEDNLFTDINIDQLEETRIVFYYEEWQKKFFSDQMKIHGTSIQGLGKLLSRVPIKKTQRKVSSNHDNAEFPGSNEAVEVSQLRGLTIL